MSEFAQVTLVERGRRLYVVHDLVMSNMPEIIRDYWPANINRDNLYERWQEGELTQSGAPGLYKLRIPPRDGGCAIYQDIYLTEGGKTMTVFREEIAVAPPKTKLETKWCDGAWYRYLKASGWKRCYGLPARPDREGSALDLDSFKICVTCNRINGKHHEECKEMFNR